MIEFEGRLASLTTAGVLMRGVPVTVGGRGACGVGLATTSGTLGGGWLPMLVEGVAVPLCVADPPW
jgi:hypothetical protein